MEYVKEKKLSKSQQEEVFKLAKSMGSLGLSDEARLQSVTFGEINYIHDDEISEVGIEMLEQEFGIKCDESTSFNSGILYAYV
jgi:S-adenosylmethionine:diacylglycerol 3-amino-3-carboxypropyl transferase